MCLCFQFRINNRLCVRSSADLDSLPVILQKKYALLRDLDKSLQGNFNFNFKVLFIYLEPVFIFFFFSLIFICWSVEKSLHRKTIRNQIMIVTIGDTVDRQFTFFLSHHYK